MGFFPFLHCPFILIFISDLLLFFFDSPFLIWSDLIWWREKLDQYRIWNLCGQVAGWWRSRWRRWTGSSSRCAGVPYMETVYGTKEEVQAEDAPLRKGLMWLQKGKLFSRYVKTRSHGLPWIPWLPVKRDEAPDCSNSMSCRHTPVNTSDLPPLLSYHIRAIGSISHTLSLLS